MQHEPIRVLHMIASLNIGGSQTMVMNLYRNIDRDKVQFDFIIDKPDETELKGEIETLGGKVFTLPTFKGINIFEVRRAWNKFFADHAEYKILHTHSRSYASVYLPIARKHGMVTIAHSHSTSNGSGKIAWVKDIMQLPIRYQADYLFACSQEAGEWLFGKKGVRSDRFKIIPNAIDTRKFAFDPEKRETVRRDLGLQDSFVIGHVGRMTEPKNHLFLLKIFKEIRKKNKGAKLLLVGDGELMENVKAEASNLGVCDEVQFIGARTNVSDYYQAMDVFVFPSLWEGLGIAAIEAQTAGLPCIVSQRVPTTADLGIGLFYCVSSLGEVDQWVRKILEVQGIIREDKSIFANKAGFDIQNNTLWMQAFYETQSKHEVRSCI